MSKQIELNIPQYYTKADIMFRDYKAFATEIALIESSNSEQMMYSTLRIFYSLSKKTANGLSAKQVTTLVALVNAAIMRPTAPFKPIIEYGGIKYGFFNFETITLGELIDLEKRYQENDLISLTSICYRPIVGKISKNGEYEIETYNGYNETLFENIDMETIENMMLVFQKAFLTLSQSTHTPMVIK